MKKHCTLLLLPLFFQAANAQQASPFLQSADFFGLENPAGLSIEEIRHPGRSFGLLVRNQWWKTSVEGWPQTQVLYLLDATPKSGHWGGTLLADKIGETRQFGLQGRYAHAIAPGLKAGASLGAASQDIAVGNLDQYDPDDPLIGSIGRTSWRMNAGAGAFYNLYDVNRAVSWFAGAAWQYARSLSAPELLTSEKPASHLFLSGGLNWRSLWASARLRFSADRSDAFDLYLRCYVAGEKFFIGSMATSDGRDRTAGLQIGTEQRASRGRTRNHYLTASLGFSRPFGAYFVGNSLIFDARATWCFEKKRRGGF